MKGIGLSLLIAAWAGQAATPSDAEVHRLDPYPARCCDENFVWLTTGSLIDQSRAEEVTLRDDIRPEEALTCLRYLLEVSQTTIDIFIEEPEQNSDVVYIVTYDVTKEELWVREKEHGLQAHYRRLSQAQLERILLAWLFAPPEPTEPIPSVGDWICDVD